MAKVNWDWSEDGNQDLHQRAEWFLEERVASSMQDYEVRPSQVEMMKVCSRIIDDGGIVIAEAGTGTGKTFAYLIPIILSDKRAIISTKTINLQEQLTSKDLRVLSLSKEITYALAKGRGNYLCLRRLNAYRQEEGIAQSEYKAIFFWSAETETGDIEDSRFRKSDLWDKVRSDPDACTGRKCPFYHNCFYFKARKKWETAQIVVANHALISINEMLPAESRLLPPADILVIDEGHALEHVLSEQIGISLSNLGFERILNRLLRIDEREKYKGLLCNSDHLFSPFQALKTEVALLWSEVRRELRDRQMIKGLFGLDRMMKDMSASIKTFVDNIKISTRGLFEENHEIELKSEMLKLTSFADSLELFAEGMTDFVRWAEIGPSRIALRMSPLYPRDFMINNVIPRYRSIIVTSATLSVSGDFGFTTGMLGLENSEKLSVPSPFNLREQVEIEIERGVDLLRGEGDIAKLASIIIEEGARRRGGILVLFTSRDVMRKTRELTLQAFSNMGLTPMIQGEELQNRTMLEIMRSKNDCIIFGLDSFWEGVDIKGDSLRTVIITKIPFEVPDEPITMARLEDITSRGGNAFKEYQLPRAILKFKQGVGRLIRSKNDTGRLIICDERVETRSYGQLFIRSLF